MARQRHPAREARADSSLLPRQLIFGNPDRTGPRISHDGKRIGWIAPKDGVLNVFVAPVDDLSKAKPVTDSKVRPIPFFLWAYDNQHILYAIDQNGDENVHVYSVDVATAGVKDLTPYEKTQGRIQELAQDREKIRSDYARLRQEAQEKIDKLMERIKELNQRLMGGAGEADRKSGIFGR